MDFFLNKLRDKENWPVLAGCLLAIVSLLVNSVDFLAFAALVECFIVLFIIYRCRFGIVSIPTIFVILTYLFHCSQFLLNALNVEYEKPLDINLLVGDDTSEFVLRYSMAVMLCIGIGLFLSAKRNPIRKINGHKRVVLTEYRFCTMLGKLLIVACVLPRLYTDILMALAYLNGGYLATFEVANSGILQVWASGFYIGAIFLLIGKQSDKAFCTKLLIFVCIYSAVTMLSGRRQEKVSYLIALVFLYFRYIGSKSVKKKQWRNLIFACVLGYVLLVLIATFGDLRQTGSTSIVDFLSILLDNLKLRMLTSQIGEFGGTGISLAFAKWFFPSYHGFNCGKTYLSSLLTVFPNIGGMLNGILTSLDYIFFFPSEYQYALGGSYLGELYFNFGVFGPVFGVIIGLALGKMSITINKCMCGRLTVNRLHWFLLISPLILWVRGVFVYFVRPYIWFSAFIILAWILEEKYALITVIDKKLDFARLGLWVKEKWKKLIHKNQTDDEQN